MDSNNFGRSAFARRQLTRKEFGKRLYNLILSKGWTQSEFARRADILKDSVSNYIRGNHLPEPLNLQKMAKVLGVEPDELLPNYAAQAIEIETDPPLEIWSGSDPTTSWIKIYRLVNTADLPKILEVINAAAPNFDED